MYQFTNVPMYQLANATVNSLICHMLHLYIYLITTKTQKKFSNVPIIWRNEFSCQRIGTLENLHIGTFAFHLSALVH